jgi:hypothetical protein
MGDNAEFVRLFDQQTQLLATMQAQISMLQQQIASNNDNIKDTSTTNSKINVPWPPPLEVDNGKNEYENFEFFKNGWQNYCLASGIDKWPKEKAEVKAGLLISAIGTAAMRRYMEFGLTDKDKKEAELIFKKIEEYIIKETNVIYSRYQFNARNQMTGEQFCEYLLSLKKLVKPCQYGSIESEMIRDRIVVGILNGDTKKELLRKADLDLDMAINICKPMEKSVNTVMVGTTLKKFARKNMYKK